jgi:hypothetical protein
VRVLALVAALLLAASAFPRRVVAQANAYRFQITEVGDSTFSFDVAKNEWVKKGMRGIAVDPQRRDALVARFKVLSVDDGSATALVTGQTTRLSPEHAALIERQPPPFYRRGSFWLGVVLGGALGAGVVGVIH